MIFKKIIFLLLFLFFVSSAYSHSFKITANIDNFLNYKENLSLQLDCNQSLELTFPHNARNIEFSNGSIFKGSSYYLNGCNSSANFSYNLDVVENLGKNSYRLERRFPNIPNLNYSFSIIVPNNFEIDANQTFPAYNVKYFDNYKQVIFNKSRIYLLYFYKKTEVQGFSINYIFTELKEQTVMLISLFFFLLGIFVSYIFFMWKNSKIMEKEVPSFVLGKEEKMIIDVIKKSPGINQKQIGKELDFSKARVSSFVNDMEQKKLIRREKFGRSFKVYLDKNIR